MVVTAILKNRNLKRFAGKSPLIGHKKSAPKMARFFLTCFNRLLFYGVENLLDESRKSCFVVDSQLGELFSVHLDIEVFEGAHKYAVFKAGRSAGSVDSGNPEAAEFAAAYSAVSVRVFARAFNRVFSVAEQARFVAEIALGGFQRARSALAGRY